MTTITFRVKDLDQGIIPELLEALEDMPGLNEPTATTVGDISTIQCEVPTSDGVGLARRIICRFASPGQLV